MWIFLNDAFLSIVAHEEEDSLLHVRARIGGDIERVFPSSEVFETPYGYYRYNANVHRDQVAQVLATHVRNIRTQEFQESIQDPARRAAYAEVWEAMADAQNAGPGEA